MDNYDRINKIREQQAMKFNEIPLSDPDVADYKKHALLYKILAIILIVVLLLSTVYTFLHPIDKIKLKAFLFRSCTIEVVASYYGYYEKEEICIDGNILNYKSEYYEIDGSTVYKYVEMVNNTWQRVPADTEWEEDFKTGNNLLDKNNFERVKGKLFTWSLKNSIAENIDDLSLVTLERDEGKIAIVGYYKGVRYSIRFIRFGRTKIELPWES